MRMIRVKEWAVDLDRLALVDRVFNDVIEKKATLPQALETLRGMEKRPPPYSDMLTLAASAGAAGAAAVFFQGGLPEMGFAAAGGLALGLAWIILRRSFELRILSDFLAGLLAALFAWLATAFDPGL